MAKPIPDGFYTITPSLIVSDAAKALDFYKKALGAQTGRLLIEYVLEASTIGGLGGAVGFGIGYGLTAFVNAMGSRSGMDIFLVTPRLTALALGFAVLMATAAGIIPAWRAARLDPVTALRSQS